MVELRRVEVNKFLLAPRLVRGNITESSVAARSGAAFRAKTKSADKNEDFSITFSRKTSNQTLGNACIAGHPLDIRQIDHSSQE